MRSQVLSSRAFAYIRVFFPAKPAFADSCHRQTVGRVTPFAVTAPFALLAHL